MSNGVVNAFTATPTLVFNGTNDGTDSQGIITSGVYNGQNLAPAYIPGTQPSSIAQAGAAVGQVLTWSGTAWVPAFLGNGSPVAGQTLEFNGTAWVATNGNALRNVITKTTAYTIGTTLGAANESNTKFVNTGATGTVAFTLPAPALGLQYIIANVVAGQTLTVASQSPGSQSIFAPGLTGGSRTTTVQFTAAMFTCYDGTNWLMHGIDGVWS
jgi:hypothetical protein